MPKSGNRQNVGILGGTFDPVHHGHLIAALRAQTLLQLTKVFFIPCALPPHKPEGPCASAEERLEMLNLATRTNSVLDVLDIEIVRGGVSYTIDTLRYLNDRHWDMGFSVIMGSDAFAEITTWKDHEQLFDEANFAIMTRCGFLLRRSVSMLPLWLSRELSHAPHIHGPGTQPEVSENSKPPKITVIEVPQIEISGSRIRRSVAAGESIQYLVPEIVREYIISRGLYRSEE